MLVFPPKNDCSMERLKQLEVMRETESPLDSKLQVVIGGGSAVTNKDLQGGCSLSSLPYQLGYTECTSEEESRVASQTTRRKYGFAEGVLHLSFGNFSSDFLVY
jgi:hypothetical protein